MRQLSQRILSPSLIYQLCWITFWIAEICYLAAVPERYEMLQSTATVPTFAVIQFIIEYIVVIIFSAFAFVILRRVREDKIAWLTAVIMATGIPNFPVLSYYASLLHPIFTPFSLLLFVLNSVLVFLWLATFPDERVYPRWLLYLLPILAIWETVRYTMIYIIRTPELLAFRPVGFAITTSFTVLALLAQFFRYRRIATIEQRQQTKWIMLPLAIFIVSSLAISVIRGWSRSTGQHEISLLVELVYTGCVLILSIFGCTALWRAITRQGLWGLDLTINRSLVALGVTGVLGIIFSALFLVLQAFLRLIFGSQQGELAVGIAAVVTFMLFENVRHRVRYIVDRQIYKLRFDLNELERIQQERAIENPGHFTGQMIGTYELLGVVGRGGMGEVYKGYSAKNRQTAAIKILKPEWINDTATRERFEREGSITLHHPNIIKTYGYGASGDIFYVAFEYLEGQTLKDILQERGKLTWSEAQDFLPALLDALDTAHARGYVHRDLKPANIGFRAKSGREVEEAVLLDFGVAKIMGRDTSITGSGAIGTIDYMSPEQINSAHSVDHRSDIYALGVMLYEILTGDVPFKGSVGKVLFSHLYQPPPDPREVLPDLPDIIAEAIMKAMSKNPQERFQTVREMLQAFDAVPIHA